MSTDGLAAFLLAQIAEDEAVVSSGGSTRHFPADIVGVFNPQCPACLAAWPGRDRFLAECEAKRRIVEAHAEAWELGREDYLEGVWRSEDHTIRLLAAVYADHPDYREEWRP